MFLVKFCQIGLTAQCSKTQNNDWNYENLTTVAHSLTHFSVLKLRTTVSLETSSKFMEISRRRLGITIIQLFVRIGEFYTPQKTSNRL